jgi:hypothetical protein
MNASELLRLQVANQLACQKMNISVGPTGPTGPTGNSASSIGAVKAFTIYMDYSAGSAINRVYIPPNLFTGALAAGGTFTADVPGSLVFYGGNSISLAGTLYPFCTGISLSGYVATSGGEWNPAPGGNISNTKTFYSQPNDYSITLKGLDLTNINGSNLAARPTAGLAAGFLATITLFYV